MAPFVFV